MPQGVAKCIVDVGASLTAGGTLVLLLGVAAAAHETVGTLGGFTSGFEHPLFGPDHFLAMFAIGLWGAQMGGSSV